MLPPAHMSPNGILNHGECRRVSNYKLSPNIITMNPMTAANFRNTKDQCCGMRVVAIAPMASAASGLNLRSYSNQNELKNSME
jgi:hypothetical protein